MREQGAAERSQNWGIETPIANNRAISDTIIHREIDCSMPQ